MNESGENIHIVSELPKMEYEDATRPWHSHLHKKRAQSHKGRPVSS